MTAEVDVHGELLEVSKSELGDECGLDLPRGGLECNGLSSHDEAPSKEIESVNGKDNTDGSYVFVTGNDAVGDDPVETGDDGECAENVGLGNKESEGGGGELNVESNWGVVQSCGDGNCVSENNNGVVSDEGETGGGAVCEEHNGTVAVVESELRQLDREMKVEVEPFEDIGENKEAKIMNSGAAESNCKSWQVVDGNEKDLEDGNSDSVQESQVKIVSSAESEPHLLNYGDVKVESESNLDQAVGGKEYQESQILVSDKEPLELANEIPVRDSLAEQGIDLEQNLKNDSNPVAAIEAVNAPISDENGDGLPEGHNLDLDIGVKEYKESQIVSSAQSGPHVLDYGEEKVESESNLDQAVGGKEYQVSQIHVSEKEPLELINEIPVKDSLEEHGIDLELNLKNDSNPVAAIEAVNEPISNENGDTLPEGHNSDLDIGVKECKESQIMVSEDSQAELGHLNETATLADESPAEGPKGDLGMDVEQYSETGLSPIEDVQFETEVVNGSVTDGSGDCLPSDYAQDSFLENKVINDLVDDGQKSPEQVESIGNAKNLPSRVDCGNEPIESDECLPSDPGSDTIVESDVGIEASVVESSPPCAVDDARLEADGEKLDAKISERAVPCPVDDSNIDGKSHSGSDTMSSFPADNVRSGSEIRFGSVDYGCKLSTFPNGDLNRESEVSNGVTEHSQPVPVDDMNAESCVIDSVKNESCFPIDVGAEPEVENASAVRGRETPAATVSASEVLNSSVATRESALTCSPDKNGNQFTDGDSCDKPTCKDAESIDGFHRAETPTSSQDGSTVDALEGQNAGAEVGKRPFYFLIRIPRYEDENLKKEIHLAQLQVDEKTQSRDAIQAELQIKRATCKEYNDNFEAALSEERAARDLLRSKRQEIDSVQSVINRVKHVISLEDTEGKIHNMQHMIEHETLDLKEEKQLMHEIKKLKQHREQLSSNMGRQDEVQQALDQKDKIEERSKFLRKEADLLRDNLLKAEAVTTAAKKKYNDENEKLYKLQAQFRAANDIRQRAYAHLQSLKKKSYEKSKYFWKYRDDAKLANDHAVNKDRESLQHLCIDQVETIMELWNKNDEFRKDYSRCNMRSTLRRLRTLDGRSLGPDEVPPVIPNLVNGRATKDNSMSLHSTTEIRKEVVPMEAEKGVDKSAMKVVEEKETTKIRKPAKPAPPLVNSTATISGRDEIEEVRSEVQKRTKEEEELARKEEELRREEEAAELKEQRRLEEKAKAKEALERKKRNVEKAQARAALRAQKEAELKEKEKEKKARKKEKRKAAGGEAADGINEGESALSSETPTETTQESETREKPVTTRKRPQKPSQFAKQTKVKSIPPPLRNRGKRRMQPWMWILLSALLIVALFLVGNSSFSSKFGLSKFGF